MAISANQLTEPFPDHDCPACERGEKKITPPHSSIVGSKPVHTPSGNVCMKFLEPEMIEALKKLKQQRDAEAID